MSDYTYGYVTSYNYQGAPAVQVSSALAGAAQVGYGFILNELATLTRPLNYNFSTSPAMQQAQTRIASRAHRLAALPSVAVNAGTPTVATTTPAIVAARTPLVANSTPVSQTGAGRAQLPATLTPAVNSRELMTVHQSATSVASTMPPVIAGAPPIVRQSFDLLARAELAVARAQNVLPSMPQPPSLLQAAQQKVAVADAAIAGGDAQAALEASRAAAEAAAALEAELAQTSAARMAQSRQAADALARPGALWTALHSQEALAQWAATHTAAQMKAIEENLRSSRNAYVEERFADTVRLSQQLEASLNALIESARAGVAREQRDAYAAEAEGVLRSMGFQTESTLRDNQRLVAARRDRRELLTIAFDEEGKFALDSRYGFDGAPVCAIEANKFLKALAEKMSFEVKERTFVAHPDHDPGRVARQRAGRRRIALSEALDQSSRTANRAAVPPQAAVAA